LDEALRTNINSNQRELFSILDEFFRRATGQSYQRFARSTHFAAHMRALGARMRSGNIGLDLVEGFNWGYETLHAFYSKHALQPFPMAQQLEGMKLVLGGSSRFYETHVNSTRRMLLYTDTILIPDPVFPWTETPRAEEAFRSMHLLESAYNLLRLKPLVDADLDYPAVLVFQSWEKSLEAYDETTRTGIYQLVRDFMGHYLGATFDDMSELVGYATSDESRFLTQVEGKRLFVPPSGHVGMPMHEALETYMENTRTWRTRETAAQVEDLGPARLVLHGIIERLSHQYHLIENSAELSAQPMLCLEQQWHYYTLCAQILEAGLLEGSLLSPATVSILRALNEPRNWWLSNIGLDDLVRLRQEKENETFRRTMDGCITHLTTASLQDIDRVAASVGREIHSLISENDRQQKEIVERYRFNNSLITGIGMAAELIVALYPSLVPFVSMGTTPVGLAIGYAVSKSFELRESRRVAKSLMGVLATVHQRSS
jgi:hypothetical protein